MSTSISRGSGGYGIIQIGFIGPQDKYINQNPEITHFKTTYKRHSKLAIESMREQNTGEVKPGGTIKVLVQRKGDLVHKTWLEIESTSTTTSVPSLASEWKSNTKYNLNDVVKGGNVGELVMINEFIATNATTAGNRAGNTVVDFNDTGFGYSTAFSRDGNSLLVGSYNSGGISTNNTMKANVKLFKRNLTTGLFEEDGGETGNSIYKDSGLYGEGYGKCVALSDDGTIMVIGCKTDNYVNTSQLNTPSAGNIGIDGSIYVYQYHSSGKTHTSNSPYGTDHGLTDVPTSKSMASGWYLRGNTPLGCPGGDGVACSGDGSIIATCNADASEDMSVRIFKWDTSGTDIDDYKYIPYGELSLVSPKQFGGNIAINKAGTRIAVTNSTWTTNIGKVYIYEHDGSNWVGVSNIQGSVAQERLGTSMAMDESGNTIVVGSDSVNSNTGQVKVFQYNGTSWVPKGINTLAGAVTGDKFGIKVSINGDGSVIAVGTNSTNNYTYKYDTNTHLWVEQGKVVYVPNNDNYNVALNASGDLLAIGAPEITLGSAGNNNYGRVSIYSTQSTFKCMQSGISGASEPSWAPTGTVTDSGTQWEQFNTGFYNSNLDAYSLFDYVSVFINNEEIVKHTSKWLKIWHQLSSNPGKREMLTQLGLVYSPSINTPPSIKRIPLEFWFCKDNGSALPISSILYHDVEIHIKLSSNITVNDKVNIWSDHVFLTETEKNKFNMNPHTYLFEQVQYIYNKSITTDNAIKLNFKHPVKELIWQLDDLNHNKLDNVQLLLNGADRFNQRDGDYFAIVQRYQHHTTTSNPDDKNIYVYSFALDPESLAPTGSLNMSKIQESVLIINGSNIGAGATVDIYAVNLNTLVVSQGVVNVLYA